MAQNTTATTDATLTEHLPAADNQDDSIESAAKITHIYNSAEGMWQTDSGESVNEIASYGVECSCGETFDTWQKATKHAENQH
jgi:uncharacterized protein (DUF2147 family)